MIVRDSRRELVEFWLYRANGDLTSARLLAKDVPANAIYMCQQAAEKALKGYLTHMRVETDKTHNIGLLLKEVKRINPYMAEQLKGGCDLTVYNQLFRYPSGEKEMEPTRGELNKAYVIAMNIYKAVAQELANAR